MEDVTRLSRCARCGAGLPIDASAELCATCERTLASAPTMAGTRLPAGEETRISAAPGATARADDVTVLSARSGSGARAPVAPKLAVGQPFGPYRVERLLGRGGMGDVYEAEHLEHGRRVAIKVLNSALAGADDLARFLSEGELAGSITHPNTVYIFGSEEIDGAPVIAMELLSGGTLRDLVQANGPLAPAHAVDVILQVIAGLDAAAKTGILHRDVKPANCFVDLHGDVKVGDFGLSISADARQQITGMFLGTPQFAPPEQLRGEALDARADIYAVGGTLFYLLTGQPPFDDRDLTTLVTRVTTEAPRSPREMRASVPPALGEIVTRCLAKNREDRPASYAALDDLLRPFSSAAPVPASLRRRFLAGATDQLMFVALVLPVTLYQMFSGGSYTAQWMMAVSQLPFWLVYFSVLEGLWGASIGKRLFGLQVTTTDGQRPGIARALGRAAIYQAPTLLTTMPYVVLGAQRTQVFQQRPLLGVLLALGYYVLLALLWTPARRRNGYAALHDRASGTRVIRRIARATHTAVDLPEEPAGPAAAAPVRAGPFEVTNSLGPTDAGELKPGFDPQLKRRVWIHVLPAGTAPVAPLLRDVGRPARLRWLSGRRASSEAWDAYEAFEGLPLSRIPRPQPWGVVRRWLLDLAIEAEAGLKDGSLGTLTADRVWITRDGQAKLLDFRAPGATADPLADAPADIASAHAWLSEVATRGLTGATAGGGAAASRSPTLLPLTARAFLDRLDARRFATPTDIVTEIRSLQSQPDAVHPWRRAASVLLPALAPIGGLVFGMLVAFGMQKMAASVPNVDAIVGAFSHLTELSNRTDPAAAVERRHVETYIAATYRATLTDEKVWGNPMTASQLGRYRPLAERILAAHPRVSPEELTEATAALGPFLLDQQKAITGTQRRAAIAPQLVPVAITAISLGLSVVFGVIFAAAFRGGLLVRMFGLAIVDARGRRAARWRATLRAVVAWTPAAVLVFLVFTIKVLFRDAAYMRAHPGSIAIIAAAALVFFAGALVAAVRPARGIQDVIAGTFVVPR